MKGLSLLFLMLTIAANLFWQRLAFSNKPTSRLDRSGRTLVSWDRILVHQYGNVFSEVPSSRFQVPGLGFSLLKESETVDKVGLHSDFSGPFLQGF